MYTSTKRREIGGLIFSILNFWQRIEYIQMEKFQFNAAQFEETQLYDKL